MPLKPAKKIAFTSCLLLVAMILIIFFEKIDTQNHESVYLASNLKDSYRKLKADNGRSSRLHAQHRDLMDLVAEYAQKFHDREKEQNEQYEEAREEYELRNEDYIQSEVEYQRKKASILRKQAQHLVHVLHPK
jgi:hypothetical protein